MSLALVTAETMARQEEFLEEGDLFRRNAVLIIFEMVELSPAHPSVFVDEVLHGIFFLGKLKSPIYSPQNIINDEEMLDALRGRYPEPFKHFSSQLPRRSPFSCVVDMTVELTGEKKENEIMRKLQKLITELKKDEAKDLISSTICVSQSNSIQDSVRYYGVSMSTSGPFPGRIIIAAACLSNWDSYVADAVMTYYPKKQKKADFDGTIKLPEQIRCDAFNFRALAQMPPCRSCGNLFGLTTDNTQVWAYGNCAEAESISNMLKNEPLVRGQVRQTSPTCTAAKREEAKLGVLNELRNILGQFRRNGFQWDGNYYTPQR